MNQTVRTIQFAVLAIASLGIAIATHYAYKPKDLASFSDVGKEFYPDFTDPNAATGLRVASYNEKTGQTDIFSVEFKNGLWRIPSHHDYPADAQDRLAKVAASMIGVPRQAMVERSAAAHKRYRLLDPLDKSIDGTEGRGDRITLFQADQTLVDFIVGNKVEGAEDLYYVRRADEERFYTANLGKFEISTKFADWINKDVLEINRNDVRKVVIDRYYVDEAKGTIVPQEQLILDRESSTADWTLDDLKENEKVKSADVNNMLTALNDMQIAGVRPKPAGMAAGLKGDEAIRIDQLAEIDLAEKGIYIHQGRFIGNEGELLVGTGDGVTYVLKFGEEFSGADVDIEVGKPAGEKSPTAKSEVASQEAKTDAEAADPAAPPADDNAEKPMEEDAKDKEGKAGRYLLVYTQFDDSLLGGPPAPPVKPEQPKETPAADTPNQPAEEKAADADAAPVDQPEVKDDAAPTPDKPAPAETKDPQKEYEAALKRYEEELEVHAIKIKDYEEKLKKGRERADELNRRFADWYYVISEDVFDRLKLKRDELVEVKAPEKAEPEKAEPEKAEPEKAEPEKAEPEKAEPEKAEPEKAEPEKAEPEKAEPEKAEPEKAEPEKAD